MIRIRLVEENCPNYVQRILGSYFNDRSVKLICLEEEVSKKTTKDCVQGSIGSLSYGTSSSTLSSKDWNNAEITINRSQTT